MNPRDSMDRSRFAMGMVAAFVVVIAAKSATRMDAADEEYFRRGDVNADGKPDISDAIFGLNFLFLGGPAPPCDDAADVNDDGKVDISDSMWLIGYLFLGDGAPPAPFTVCGIDPTTDELGCSSFAPCPVTEFADFVLGLLENSADDTDPVDLRPLSFRFTDDPTAFDTAL
jgi:hypothetical protein